MNELTAALMLVAIAVVTLKWRTGLLVCVVVAMLQDPLRKLAPGKPVIYVGLVGIVFAAAWLGAWVSRVRLNPSVIHGWKRDLQLPFTLFCILLVVQSLHAIVRWSNPYLPAIGAIFYLAPIAAVIFAHQFAVRVGTRGVSLFMWLYVGLALVWFFSIYLEFSGIKSPVLGEVGVGQIIYDQGLNVRANSGLFRASEIAAWHVATASCFLFILVNGRKLSVPKMIGVALIVVFLVTIGTLTGRRKMLVQVVIFGSTYLFLFAWFLKGKARLAVISIIAGVVSFAFVLAVMGPDRGDKTFDAVDKQLGKTDQFEAWKNRGLGVFKDIPDRFVLLGYKPVVWAIDGFGWFGAGLGTASQGSQYFGGGAEKFGGAGEGGLGKVTMDLGVPGLVIFGWLAVTVVRLIRQRLFALSRASRPHATLAFGLVAFLVSNAAAFSIATQAFGDVFILLILGLCTGFVLALPAVAAREITEQMAATRQPEAPPMHNRRIDLSVG